MMAAKTLKNPYHLKTMTFKISQKEKVKLSVALVVVFLAAENETWQLEDFVAEEKVINWQFCKLNFTSLFVFVMIQGSFLILSLIANPFYNFSEIWIPFFLLYN